MKNKKCITLLLISILLSSLMVTSCGKKVTAQECAQVIWNLNVKHDISNISKIGLKEEEAKTTLNNDIKEAKEGTVWVPKDRTNFGAKIGQFSTNQI